MAQRAVLREPPAGRVPAPDRLSLYLLYRSLRPDVGLLQQSGEHPATGFTRRLIAGWRGIHHERDAAQRAQSRLAPAVLIAYGWVFTLVGFDFFMSLDPHWFSTLAGGYYFIGNLFLGLAFLSVVAVWAQKRLNLTEYIGPHQLHDIGKLLFGFCILWAYMFWSQYLVIWYGDLAEETEFIYHRMHGAWAPVAWTVFAMAFVIPFVVLLSRAVKTSRRGLTAIAAVAFAGMCLERFLLVSPSLWHGEGVPLGLVELLVGAGVAGCSSGRTRRFSRRSRCCRWPTPGSSRRRRTPTPTTSMASEAGASLEWTP